MKNIVVLLPYDYKLFSIATILDVFETVNGFYSKKNNEPPFSITVVQTREQINRHGHYFHGYTIRSLHSKLKADIVLLPAFTSNNLLKTIDKNNKYIPWLQKQFRAGAEMASVCTGAYLFAATGLLNGRLATTHMDACPNFITDFPLVYVKPGRTVTVDGRCYTSGGASSTFHLLVFLIQKHCGNEMAVKISKTFAIDLNRYQQSYFSTFRPDYSHNDDMIKKMQRAIEADYYHINTIEELTKDLPASRRNIVRRFKQATGVPPIAYLQHTRIEKAKEQLEQTNLNISEIINETGYTDPKSFRRVFIKLVGMTPMEYRSKLGVK